MPAKEYIASFLEKTERYIHLRCLPIIPTAVKNNNVPFFNQLSVCLNSTKKEERKSEEKMCKIITDEKADLKALVPVIDENNVMYVNYYCALCNGQNDYKWINITAERCVKSSSIEVGENQIISNQINRFHNCTYGTSIIGADLCNRVKALRGDELVNDPRLRKCTYFEFRLCRSYQARVCVNKAAYFNPHCYKCIHGTEVSGDVCRFDDGHPGRVDRNAGGYSMTINFIDDVIPRVAVQCMPNYYPYNGRCLSAPVAPDPPEPPTAAPREPAVTTNPPEPKSLVKPPETTSIMHWIPTLIQAIIANKGSIFLLVNNKELSKDTIEILRNGTENTTLDARKMVYFDDIYYKIEVTKADKKQAVNIIHQLRMNENLWQHIRKTIISPLPNLIKSSMYGLDLQRMFSKERLCVFPKISNVSKQMNRSDSFPINLKTMSFENSTYWVEVMNDTFYFYAAECALFHLSSSCPIKKISEQHYKVYPNKSVELIPKRDNSLIGPPDYMPVQDGILVCDHNVKEEVTYNWQSQLTMVRKVVVTIGGCLSVVSLTLTIFTYLFFDTLRNTPGKNLVALSITILISDILAMATNIGHKSTFSCKALAVLLHWSLLSQTAWCTTVTFDLWHTFRSNMRPNPISFKKYCIVTCSASCLFILICFIVSLVNEKLMKYGQGNNYCWIVSKYSRIVTYVLPVALTLIVNTVLFVNCIRNIAKRQKESSAALKGSSMRQDISVGKLIVKIALLIGVIEIIGFIQIDSYSKAGLIAKDLFFFIYAIVKSLRGVFIFLLFTAKRRIWSMYAAKLGVQNNTSISSSETNHGNIALNSIGNKNYDEGSQSYQK